MIINHNMMAMNANRMANINQNNASKAMAKLSSGLRINSAADDAAGLAISEKMKGQINGLNQASSNAQDGISMVQTADGALNETTSILQRMRELAVQSSNDTNTSDDRSAIQTEMNQLTSEINTIGSTTQFNTKNLLDGTISAKSGIVTAGNLTAGTTTLSNLTLDGKSSLAAGNYNITISDSTAKSATDTADSTFTGVSIDPSSTLTAGNYKIDVQQSQAEGATLTTPADSVTGVSINPLSTETEGPHTVEITRTDSVAPFTGTNTGLGSVAVTSSTPAGNSGTYTISTAAKLSDVSAGTSADTSGLMTLSLDNSGALGNATGYKLAYTQESAGIYSVQLTDAGGTAVSEKVILDDNQQNYKFKVFGSPATDLGVSFTTTTGINTALTASNSGAGADGLNDTFDVSTDLTLKQGTTQIGTTANIAAGAGAGNVTIGDFKINYTSGASLTNGKSDNLTVNNTLTATIDGADSHTFNAGDTINFADGMNVNTSSDITKYDATTPKDYAVNVGTTDTYTATVQTSGGAAVSGAQTVTVDAANGGSYNLGNGVNFTLAAGKLTAATSHNFTVADTTTTNATLTNTDTSTNAATKTVTGNGTLDFGNGLTVDAADKTNGTASFKVTGSVKDQSLVMQIGANQGQSMSIGIDDMRAEALGISGDSSSAKTGVDGASYVSIAGVTDGTGNANPSQFALDIGSASKATAAIKVIDNATAKVSAERSNLGAYQNRLESTINSLGTESQNLTSAQSAITDVDMAAEMAEYSKDNVESQAAQAMLAQANQQPQQVLQLLR